MKILVGFIIALMGTEMALANKCGEFIYNKKGWLRKYEHMNLTLTENTQKHGTSTTSGISTESSTASSDLGVWGGHMSSYAQVTSSKGPCSLGGIFSYNAREKYINQNIAEVKKEFARGEGKHLETIVYFSQCSQSSVSRFANVIKENITQFSKLKKDDAKTFSTKIDELIKNDEQLSKSCAIRA
jgi:hypothetical protein